SMNPDTHNFEPLDSPAAFEVAKAKGWKIFKTGEKVTLKETDFTVIDIQPNKLILRPFGSEALKNDAEHLLNETLAQHHGNHPPHQQRVFIERNDLEEKLGKLRSFFNSSTYAAMAETPSGREEQDRLQEQADIMDKYRAILVERIAAF
ncbi:MAG: crAss001_48 related protein, partial [Terriglobales bacterium]